MTDFMTYSLDDLFREALFVVPDYQRGYDWTQKEVSDFWRDLLDLPADRQHYLGTVVLYQTQARVTRDRPIQHYTVHEVVDGQQRLTTIIILLQCMLVDFRRQAAGNATYNDSIPFVENFLHIVSNGQQRLRLTLNRDLEEFFRLRIMQDAEHPEEELVAQQLLIGAKRFFRDRLREEEAKRASFGAFLDELQDKLTSRMRFTVFKTREQADVGLMFETLNNRGRPLTEMEKVKNYLLYTARGRYRGHIEQLDELVNAINATWTSVLKTLADFKVADAGAVRHEDHLIRMHGLSVSRGNVGQWHTQAGAAKVKELIIASAGPRLDYGPAILNYCSTLSEGVVMYCILQKPMHDLAYARVGELDPIRQNKLLDWTWKVAELKGDKAFCPLLMQASRVCSMADGDFHPYFYTLLAYSEVYMVRVYKVANRRTSAGHQDLFRLAASLADVPRGAAEQCMPGVLRRIKELIRKFSGDFGDLSYTYSQRRDYDEVFMKYVLYEYERDLRLQPARAQRTLVPLDKYDQLTVEHVLPRTWSEEPMDYWHVRFPDRSTHQDNCYALGNLSLTTGTRNSAYNNRPFDDKQGNERMKKQCYANSHLLIERQFVSAGHWPGTPPREWTPEAIRSRGNHIAKWMEQRWGHPMKNVHTFLPASFDVAGFFDEVAGDEKADESVVENNAADDPDDEDEEGDSDAPTAAQARSRVKRTRRNTAREEMAEG